MYFESLENSSWSSKPKKNFHLRAYSPRKAWLLLCVEPCSLKVKASIFFTVAILRRKFCITLSYRLAWLNSVNWEKTPSRLRKFRIKANYFIIILYCLSYITIISRYSPNCSSHYKTNGHLIAHACNYKGFMSK